MMRLVAARGSRKSARAVSPRASPCVLVLLWFVWCRATSSSSALIGTTLPTSRRRNAKVKYGIIFPFTATPDLIMNPPPWQSVRGGGDIQGTTVFASGGNNAEDVADFISKGIDYFSSIRTPAALIATTSFTSLFALVGHIQKQPDERKRSKIENFIVSMYHVLSLVSLLLSINVIFTATATGNTLLLRSASMTAAAASSSKASAATVLPPVSSPYEFLLRHFEFEFLECRWGFYASLFSMLGSTLLRAIISFDLPRKKARRKPTIVVVLSISSFVMHLLTVTNDHLQAPYSNFGSMTYALLRLYVQRALFHQRTFLGVASLATAAASVVLSADAVNDYVRRSYDSDDKPKDE